MGFWGVSVREGAIDEREFLGARDQVEPDVVFVRGGADAPKDCLLGVSDTLGDR